MTKWVSPHQDGLGPLLGRFFGAFEPALQGLAWSTPLGLALWLNWGERRVQRSRTSRPVLRLGGDDGKGPEGSSSPRPRRSPGWGPRRWSELLRLEIATGIAVWVALVLPWFVAMYVRHGSVFTDRLIFHDMVNRTLGHMHDTNEGDDTSLRFYVWQLGYAFFPWSGLVPLGLLYWIRQRGSSGGSNDAAIVLFMWFLLTFALVTFMGTKFHHYIFPAVPPLAMLVGIVVDRLLGAKRTGEPLARNLRPPRAPRSRHAPGPPRSPGRSLLALVGRDLLLKRRGDPARRDPLPATLHLPVPACIGPAPSTSRRR